MYRKITSHLTKGRPSIQNYIQLRSEVFKKLLAKGRDVSSEPLMKYSDLANDLHINLKTIRSVIEDIRDVSAEFVLTSGGIRIRQTYFHKNLRKAREIKDALADKFVELIPKDVTLACSAGTTVAFCVKRLIEEGQYHVIITNNVGVIDQLSGSDITNLIFTGGEYKPAIHCCVGNPAIEAFREAKCQAALIGVSGINEKGDLFVRHYDEIPVYNQILRSVIEKVFIVADARKLSQEDTWSFMSIRQLLEDEQRPNLNVYLITTRCQSLDDLHSRNRACAVFEALSSVHKRFHVVLAETVNSSLEKKNN